MAETCPNCGGERWVCEEHPHLPWTEEGCQCGAGMPCRICNPCDENNPPAMPPGTTIRWDIHGEVDEP